MPMFKRGGVVLLLMLASACSGSNPLPSAPSTPSVGPTSTFHVTGIATEDDGNPVAGANITVQPWVDSVQKSVLSVVVVTDGAGFYRLDFAANRDAGGFIARVKAESPGHDTAYYNIRPEVSTSQNASQNIHLYRIKRISAGESTVMTLLPSDTLCGGNTSESVCRKVHIVAPSDGLMTIEIVPTPSTGAYSLGAQVVGGPPGFFCGDDDDLCSIPVTAGADVVATIGIFFFWTFPDSQTFLLKTSLVRP
jgi:hypothetical protein